jgi:hypothetical protein
MEAMSRPVALALRFRTSVRGRYCLPDTVDPRGPKSK